MFTKRTSLTIVFFILVVALHYIGWLSWLEKAFRSIATPLISDTHSINIQVGNSYEYFKNRNDLETAYAACVVDNQNHLLAETKMKLLQDENDTLRSALQYVKNATVNTVTATVVGKEILSPDQTIIIDQGSETGIKVNDPVITGNGILVGKIMKVDQHISMVRLINDTLSKVGALVLNRDHSNGVVEGGYNISLTMGFIPRDEVVQKGDQVVTSGLEAGMPKGLLIGTIAVVENEPYKPFQDAFVTPATDLSKISIVTVLKTQ